MTRTEGMRANAWSGLKMESALKEKFSEPTDEIENITVLSDSLAYEGSDSLEYAREAYAHETFKFYVWRLLQFPQLAIRMTHWAPEYDKLDLQTIAELVLRMPDVRLFTSITVLDSQHKEQGWLKLQGEDWVITREIFKDGRVLLYMPDNLQACERDIEDAFAQLLKYSSEAHSRIFDRLIEIEGATFFSRPQKNDWTSEQIWNDLFRLVFCCDFDRGSLAAQIDAVPAVVIASALKARLDSLPVNLQSPQHAHFVKLLKFIEDEVHPLALERIAELQGIDSGLIEQFKSLT